MFKKIALNLLALALICAPALAYDDADIYQALDESWALIKIERQHQQGQIRALTARVSELEEKVARCLK